MQVASVCIQDSEWEKNVWVCNLGAGDMIMWHQRLHEFKGIFKYTDLTTNTHTHLMGCHCSRWGRVWCVGTVRRFLLEGSFAFGKVFGSTACTASVLFGFLIFCASSCLFGRQLASNISLAEENGQVLVALTRSAQGHSWSSRRRHRTAACMFGLGRANCFTRFSSRFRKRNPQK